VSLSPCSLDYENWSVSHHHTFPRCHGDFNADSTAATVMEKLEKKTEVFLT